MASEFTPTGIEKPGIGEQENTWGDTLNDNFDLIEAMINGVIDIDASGSSDVVLSDVQRGNRVIIISGTLTGNIAVEYPASEEYAQKVINSTSGAFTVTFKVTGATGVVVDQGDAADIYSDGTDVALAAPGVSAGGTGATTQAGARAAFDLQHNNVNLAYAAQFYS